MRWGLPTARLSSSTSRSGCSSTRGRVGDRERLNPHVQILLRSHSEKEMGRSEKRGPVATWFQQELLAQNAGKVGLEMG